MHVFVQNYALVFKPMVGANGKKTFCFKLCFNYNMIVVTVVSSNKIQHTNLRLHNVKYCVVVHVVHDHQPRLNLHITSSYVASSTL